MTILVTGSAGHLGEGLCRTLADLGHDVVGLDVVDGPFTTRVGSIVDPEVASAAMRGVDVVMHTATLHKPHVATHTRQAFIDTNVSGTANLLDAAEAAGVRAFLFTSTTSTFGHALRAPAGAPAVWVTEALRERPKNIYGVTKVAAEGMCALFHQRSGIPCLILRTSRFFPEADDNAATRAAYSDQNAKTNEFLYRRLELADVVSGHLCGMARAADVRFGTYILSATTPFAPADAPMLGTDAPAVIRRLFPDAAATYARLGWSLPPVLDRVYDNARARRDLGWEPAYDFRRMLDTAAAGEDPRSPLARAVGSRGYHPGQTFEGDAPYPV